MWRRDTTELWQCNWKTRARLGGPRETSWTGDLSRWDPKNELELIGEGMRFGFPGGGVSRGRWARSWNGQTSAWKGQRARSRGWDEARMAGLCGLMDSILRAVGCPRGAGMQGGARGVWPDQICVWSSLWLLFGEWAGWGDGCRGAQRGAVAVELWELGHESKSEMKSEADAFGSYEDFEINSVRYWEDTGSKEDKPEKMVAPVIERGQAWACTRIGCLYHWA